MTADQRLKSKLKYITYSAIRENVRIQKDNVTEILSGKDLVGTSKVQ